MTADAAIATMPCPACHHDVPAGRFCVRCGAHLSLAPGQRPGLLRVRDFAAAPGENVLQPSILSSLFPQLPTRSRIAFRFALALVVVVLIAFCLLQWYVPMLALAIFAAPTFVAIYLVESRLLTDLPAWVWVLTVVLGIGVGVGWATLTDAIVAETYSLGLGSQIPTTRLLRDVVVIPFGALLALQLPAIVVRLVRAPVRESLHGFVIGLVGATAFTLATNVVRMIPQFGDSTVTGDLPIEDMLLQAGVRGIAEPLTGLALGGLVGAGLWYARRDGPDRRGVLVVGGLGLIVGAAAYACVGLAEAYRLPPYLQFTVHAVLAVAAIIALRLSLQLTMLREEHAAVFPELPILCIWCHHVVPDTKFCPACGVAGHAASQTSRTERRENRPQPHIEVVEQ
ncbi:ribosomal protein S27AE [Mycolicibacterium sp. BK634]|uniref:zinc ribbon domain-containing protein n=1 Tax=Mycobacteriaceae TaxID=1762 RepID=UPI00105E7F04|nr:MULTISPECIES: zinc ribbon domain-containing protein [Mycobacteriaceae]MBB3751609.1 ribosomal protein S27AE [Mycolicibacterium sp. BK634]TDO12123.1 protease prsW family protein [Mycobacterium sp. BK086]